jgi:hypothetical protein
MRILFISTALPPNFESQTIRNLYLIKGLQDAGHIVDGVKNITTHNDESLIKILPEGLNILSIQNGWYLKLRNWVGLRNIYFLNRIFDVLGPLLIIPDLNAGWSKIVIKDKNLLDLSRKCDLIISASGSYEAHLAGLYLSKTYQKPLIAEMGDPWAFNPIWPENSFFKKFFNKILEKKVINQSKLITFTTRETKEFYKNYYAVNKFHYIPMGYATNEFNLEKHTTKQDKTINIVYVGVAFKGSRDITPLLDKIYKIKSPNIRMHFYGKVSDAFKAYVNSKEYNFVNFYGQIDYMSSIDIIAEADVLVIIGNDSKLQIPGKTYMYLASGKPILYIANQKLSYDPTWKLIKQFNGVYGFSQNLSNLEDTVINLDKNYDAFLKESNLRFDDPSLKKFDWKNLGSKFAKIVEQACE